MLPLLIWIRSVWGEGWAISRPHSGDSLEHSGDSHCRRGLVCVPTCPYCRRGLVCVPICPYSSSSLSRLLVCSINKQNSENYNLHENIFQAEQHSGINVLWVSLMFKCLKNTQQKKYVNNTFYKIEKFYDKAIFSWLFSVNDIYCYEECKADLRG